MDNLCGGFGGVRWCPGLSWGPSCGFCLETLFIGTSWFLRSLRPSRDQKRGNCPGQIDRELCMARSGLYGATPSPVGITDLVAKAAKLVHDGLAVAENRFEAFLGVLVRGEVEGGCALRVELGQVGLIVINLSHVVEKVLADAFQKCPRRGDGSFRIVIPAVKGFLPRRFNSVGMQRFETAENCRESRG